MHMLFEFLLSVHMLAGNTSREFESDTVAEQELKTVKRDFGGLNEGIWPKSSLDHQTWFNVRKDGSVGATEPAGAQRWTTWSAMEKMDQLEQ
ncbi:hypothetical protein F511_35691 [Dorcoceras hygrometricum]|uniref:Uncharacterized protein n=1 Tax=Dorcoceras hygrometricum TaxID=472368 RepID=A0A2Z7AIX7_9LAMI|nr:hypothetical protein F511_35691 [Dorcoceras hygrometricum]